MGRARRQECRGRREVAPPERRGARWAGCSHPAGLTHSKGGPGQPEPPQGASGAGLWRRRGWHREWESTPRGAVVTMEVAHGDAKSGVGDRRREMSERRETLAPPPPLGRTGLRASAPHGAHQPAPALGPPAPGTGEPGGAGRARTSPRGARRSCSGSGAGSGPRSGRCPHGRSRGDPRAAPARPARPFPAAGAPRHQPRRPPPVFPSQPRAPQRAQAGPAVPAWARRR